MPSPRESSTESSTDSKRESEAPAHDVPQSREADKKSDGAPAKTGKSEGIGELERLEQSCQTAYDATREKHGLDHEATLDAALRLIDQWVGFYFLVKADKLLKEIFPLCKIRGGALYVRVVQSSAFVRFKQYRFAESLDLMLIQRRLLGKSVVLCENIGHVYNSLGQTEKAEDEFREGLALLRADSTSHASQTAGLLLGLAHILMSKADHDAAIGHFEEAKKAYLLVHDTEHSLIAKTTMYIGDAYNAKGALTEAVTQYRECVRIFIITCGKNTPLTATAWRKLASVLREQGDVDEALTLMKEALQYEVTFNPLRLGPTVDMLMSCLQIQTSRDTEAERRSASLVPVARAALAAARAQNVKKDANFAVLNKIVAEVLLLANEPTDATALLSEAIKLFEDDQGVPPYMLSECRGLRELSQQLTPA